MRDLILYRDRKGEPIHDVIRWAELHEDRAYHYVAKDTLPNGRQVLTIWEGISGPCGAMFYTGVFAHGFDRRTRSDMLEEIPSDTEAEALARHAEAVAKWR